MLRRNVVVVALLCAAGTAFAQEAPPAAQADWQARHQQWEQKWQQERARMEQQRLDRMAVLLDMTPAQKQQVQTIFSAEHSQMRQAMKQAMAARNAARADAKAKLGQVLSPAQMKKLELLMPQRHRGPFMGMRMRGYGGMHEPMGVRGPDEMWQSRPDDGPGPPPPPPQ